MAAKLLKRDLLGDVSLVDRDHGRVVVRDCSGAPPPLRPFARWLLHREAGALRRLEGVAGVPRLLSLSRSKLERSYLEGRPLHESQTADPGYFRAALQLVRRLHAAGLVHNDLAKEPNLLVRPDGGAALIDFQVALYPRRRSRLFRVLGREDLRHLLKHKRTYCGRRLTARQRRMLEQPSVPSRMVRRGFKPVYHFVTRRLLGWEDREGAERRRGGPSLPPGRDG